MQNSGKIILDLCGGTGSWSEPYRKAGYTVVLATLPHFDVCNTIFDTELFMLRSPTESAPNGLPVRYDEVYGILAAPPCTQFSFARQRYKRPPDFVSAMLPVEACLKIIWQSRKYGSLKWWALENPTGHLRKFLGRPPFSFRHWEFDGYHVKPTDIWGWFNTPRKTQRTQPKISAAARMKRWANPRIPGHLRNLPTIGDRRAAVRAITPPGFARAFFRANP